MLETRFLVGITDNELAMLENYNKYKESGFGREGGMHGLSAYLKLS